MYHLALAQTRGEAIRGTLTSPEDLPPEEQLSTMVDLLAKMDGDDQAARLLGLTPGEVAAHRARSRQILMRMVLRHLPRDRPLG